MFEQGTQGTELRTWLVDYLPKLHELKGHFSIRRGRPRRGGLTQDIAGTVEDWRGNEAAAEGDSEEGEEGEVGKKRTHIRGRALERRHAACTTLPEGEGQEAESGCACSCWHWSPGGGRESAT